MVNSCRTKEAPVKTKMSCYHRSHPSAFAGALVAYCHGFDLKVGSGRVYFITIVSGVFPSSLSMIRLTSDVVNFRYILQTNVFSISKII